MSISTFINLNKMRTFLILFNPLDIIVFLLTWGHQDNLGGYEQDRILYLKIIFQLLHD